MTEIDPSLAEVDTQPHPQPVWLQRALAAGVIATLLGVLAWSRFTGGVEHLDLAVPALPVAALDGAPVQVGDGVPTVYFVWLPGCGACAAQAPVMEAARARYASQGVRFVGVSVLPDAARTRHAAQADGLEGPLALTTGNLLDTLGLGEVPSVAWFDGRGRLVARVDGPVSAAVLDRETRALLR